MSANAVVGSVSASASLWHDGLLWLCVGVGVLSCLLVFWVTVRHHRLRSRGQGSGTGDEEPVIYDSSLLAEIFWVLVPMLMVLGLGAWALAGQWGGDEGARPAHDRHSMMHDDGPGPRPGVERLPAVAPVTDRS